MMFGVLRGGPAWRARLPVPPLPLLKAVEEPLRMQARPGLAALLFDHKADLGERWRTIDSRTSKPVVGILGDVDGRIVPVARPPVFEFEPYAGATKSRPLRLRGTRERKVSAL